MYYIRQGIGAFHSQKLCILTSIIKHLLIHTKKYQITCTNCRHSADSDDSCDIQYIHAQPRPVYKWN